MTGDLKVKEWFGIDQLSRQIVTHLGFSAWIVGIITTGLAVPLMDKAGNGISGG
jgi:hypothetical protein